MQQLIPLIVHLSQAFNRLGLRYALGGALANNYWGIVRATADIDSLVLIPSLKYQELSDELLRLGYTLPADETGDQPVTAAAMIKQAQDRKFIELYCDGIRVELFVPILPLQHEILRRAVRLPFENTELPVTTAEDLILLKLAFHRQKDLADVRGILWVQRGKLDLDYVRTWSRTMLDESTRRELDEWIRDYSGP